MIHSGPFQPRPFCDSAIYYIVTLVTGILRYHFLPPPPCSQDDGYEMALSVCVTFASPPLGKSLYLGDLNIVIVDLTSPFAYYPNIS